MSYVSLWTQDPETFKTVKQLLQEKARKVQNGQDQLWQHRKTMKKKREAYAMEKRISTRNSELAEKIVNMKEILEEDYARKKKYQSRRSTHPSVVLHGGHCLQCMKPFSGLADNSVCRFHPGFAVNNKNTRKLGAKKWNCCGIKVAFESHREHHISGCFTSPQHMWRVTAERKARMYKSSRLRKHDLLTSQKLSQYS